MLEQPRTHVALEGENVTFHCRGHGNSKLNIDNTYANSDSIGYFNNYRKIFWVYESETDGCDGISQWNISVLANNRNNNTKLYCLFVESPCRVETSLATLILVEGHII